MSLTLLCSLAVLLSASAAIVAEAKTSDRAEQPRARRWCYVCKPLTTVLILLLALLAPADTGPGSQMLFVLGLAASLIGDIWLMLPRDRFVAGLASFAVAQVCYISAFGGTLRACPPLWTWLPYLAYASGIAILLWRGAGQMRLAVLVYAMLLVSMAWLAGARWVDQRSTAALLGWCGALLFVASDSLLALDRFRGPIRYAPAWILGTYYVGQWLIALGA